MKKKETSNVVIYLCILLLAMIIAVPPILRTLVPKEEQNNNVPVEKKKIVLLTCSKTSDDASYQINNKTKFINNEVSTVTITYTANTPAENPIGSENSEQQEPVNPSTDDNQSVPEDQTSTDNQTRPTILIADPILDIFRNLTEVEIREDENTFNIVMTQKTVESNSDVKEIANFFNLLPNQQKYYEGLGYTCTRLES